MVRKTIKSDATGQGNKADYITTTTMRIPPWTLPRKTQGAAEVDAYLQYSHSGVAVYQDYRGH